MFDDKQDPAPKEKTVQRDYPAEALQRYQEFDEQCWNKGNGYNTGKYPIFDKYMEGLEPGLFLFAALSNAGKALELETPILLADGHWTTMGFLEVGDVVLGENGLPATVIATSGIQYNHECFQITFDDNEKIVADAEHNWVLTDGNTYTTKELYEKLNGTTIKSKRLLSIPLTKPIQGKRIPGGIDPYLTGVQMGVTWGDATIPDFVRKKIGKTVMPDPPYNANGSVYERKEKLRGLVDTIGESFQNGTMIRIKTHSSSLVATLVRSLGYKCQDNGYSVVIWNTGEIASHDNPAIPHTPNPTCDEKYVVSIIPVPKRDVKCITVDSPGHCYLAGRGLTVTHNSALVLDLLWSYALNSENNLSCLYFSLDDTASKIIPRVIAKEQQIPISVVSKPRRYQNIMSDPNVDRETYEKYNDYLHKRSEGLEMLRSHVADFSVLDGTQFATGEDILTFCEEYQAYLKQQDPPRNLIVGIDSVADVTFNRHFNTENEYNNFTSRELKKWAAEVLKVPIFGTMHLRKIDVKKRPTISDVKESGRWVYEADMVFLLHNDVSINKEAAAIYVLGENGEKIPIIELDWSKNKQSSFKGRTYVMFQPDYSRITELTEEQQTDINHRIYGNI